MYVYMRAGLYVCIYTFTRMLTYAHTLYAFGV